MRKLRIFFTMVFRHDGLGHLIGPIEAYWYATHPGYWGYSNDWKKKPVDWVGH